MPFYVLSLGLPRSRRFRSPHVVGPRSRPVMFAAARRFGELVNPDRSCVCGFGLPRRAAYAAVSVARVVVPRLALGARVVRGFRFLRRFLCVLEYGSMCVPFSYVVCPRRSLGVRVCCCFSLTIHLFGGCCFWPACKTC